jgi:hypothetical protein
MRQEFLLKEKTNRLVIEIAENGYLVYVNQDFQTGTVRPLPYVFETIESMQEFISKKFTE